MVTSDTNKKCLFKHITAIFIIFFFFTCVFGFSNDNIEAQITVSTFPSKEYIKGTYTDVLETIFSINLYNSTSGYSLPETITEIQLNESMKSIWYLPNKNINKDKMPFRFPIIIQNNLDTRFFSTNIIITGTMLVDSTPGLNLGDIDPSKLYIVDPLSLSIGSETNGAHLPMEFVDKDNDGNFDNEDYISFSVSLGPKEKRLYYLYDPPFEETSAQNLPSQTTLYPNYGNKPSIVIDSKGRYHMLTLINNGDATAWFLDRVKHFIYDPSTNHWDESDISGSSWSMYWQSGKGNINGFVEAAIDSNDNIYAVWTNNWNCYTQYARYDAESETWGPVKTFEDGCGKNGRAQPAVVVDSNDVAHIFFEDYNWYAYDGTALWHRCYIRHIMYKGGYWVNTHIQDTFDDPNLRLSFWIKNEYGKSNGKIIAKTDSDGNIHALWTNYYQSRVVYARFSSNSQTWGHFRSFPINRAQTSMPIDLVIHNPSHTVHIFHYYDSKKVTGLWHYGYLYHRASFDNGKSWTHLDYPGGESELGCYKNTHGFIPSTLSAAVNAEGDVVVVWYNPLLEKSKHYYTVWESSSQSFGPINVIKTGKYGSNVLALVDNSNNFHLLSNKYILKINNFYKHDVIHSYLDNNNIWTHKTISKGEAYSRWEQLIENQVAGFSHPSHPEIAFIWGQFLGNNYQFSSIHSDTDLSFYTELNGMTLSSSEILVLNENDDSLLCYGKTDNTGSFSCKTNNAGQDVMIAAQWKNATNMFFDIPVPSQNIILDMSKGALSYNVLPRESIEDNRFTTLSTFFGSVDFGFRYTESFKPFSFTISFDNSLLCSGFASSEKDSSFICNSNGIWKSNLEGGQSCDDDFQCQSNSCTTVGGKKICAYLEQCLQGDEWVSSGTVFEDKYCDNGEWKERKQNEDSCSQSYECKSSYCVKDSLFPENNHCCTTLCVYNGTCYKFKEKIHETLYCSEYGEIKTPLDDMSECSGNHQCKGGKCDGSDALKICCTSPQCVFYNETAQSISCLAENTTKGDMFCFNGYFRHYNENCTSVGTKIECKTGTCISDIDGSGAFCCDTSCVFNGKCYKNGDTVAAYYCLNNKWKEYKLNGESCTIDAECKGQKCSLDFHGAKRCTSTSSCMLNTLSIISGSYYTYDNVKKYCLGGHWYSCYVDEDCAGEGNEYWCDPSDFMCKAPECGNERCEISNNECKSNCTDCSVENCKNDGFCNPSILEHCGNSNDCNCEGNSSCLMFSDSVNIIDPIKMNPFGCAHHYCGNGKCDTEFGECNSNCIECSVELCKNDVSCNIAVGENCHNSPDQCICGENMFCSATNPFANAMGCYSANCGNSVCEPIPECAQGCGDCTLDHCITDGKCDYSFENIIENCENSPVDCACPNSYQCYPNNTRSDERGCLEPKCGDSLCSLNEDCSSCEKDCGKCLIISPLKITGTITEGKIFTTSISLENNRRDDFFKLFFNSDKERDIGFSPSKFAMGFNETKNISVTISKDKVDGTVYFASISIINKIDAGEFQLAQIPVELNVYRPEPSIIPTETPTITPTPTPVPTATATPTPTPTPKPTEKPTVVAVTKKPVPTTDPEEVAARELALKRISIANTYVSEIKQDHNRAIAKAHLDDAKALFDQKKYSEATQEANMIISDLRWRKKEDPLASAKYIALLLVFIIFVPVTITALYYRQLVKQKQYLKTLFMKEGSFYGAKTNYYGGQAYYAVSQRHKELEDV